MARVDHGHQHFEKATDALKHEHRIIERVLAVLERLTESSAEPSMEVCEKALDFIRSFADRCHHLKEEGILFPALEKKGIPVHGGPIGVMLMEHEEGRAYVRGMADALSRASEGPTARTALIEKAKAYLRLLREHIGKEDEILFPMADEALSLEEQKGLLREFEEHELKEMGPGVHEKYLKVAQELERYRP